MFRFIHFPLVGKIIYPKAIRNFPEATGKLFLTFDDGPHPEITPDVLKILDKYNAKATFFCLGEQVKLYPEVYRSILTNGHAVGIHGYLHVNGLKCSLQEYLENIDQSTPFIHSTLFRPPYGKMKRRQYKSIVQRFKIILWDVMSYDFDSSFSSDQLVKMVCNKSKNGSIIVFHDSLKTKNKVIEVLPIILEHFKSMRFSSIEAE
jgi:peptidoglycan/xylan/chitin deacetylase (PgdA/CDA1 family)